MPADDNTPASTRRFLPASTSSVSRSSGPTSLRRNPFQSSRPTQTASSSVPLSATPRFQRPETHAKDDIDTSFEDYLTTPALPPSHSTVKTQGAPDVIDDDFQDLSPLLQRRSHLEREAVLENRRRPIRNVDPRRDPSTPTKKRKVFHLKEKIPAPITISSSPENHEDDDLDAFPEPDSPLARSLYTDNSDGAVESPDGRETATTSRFKDVVPAVNEPNAVPRSAFRPAARNDNIVQAIEGSALPDIFSPSKRRGKHDYIPGGNAELVRNWVLNITAQESHMTQQNKDIINVTEVRPDSSGRFVTVLDQDRMEWLLPDQQQDSRINLKSSLTRIRPGCKVMLKGRATKWSLPVYSSTSNTVKVAAYWELLS